MAHSPELFQGFLSLNSALSKTALEGKLRELAYIKTELPTNVGFGRGDAASVLYITAGKSLYRIKLNAEGYHLPPKK